MTVWVIVGDAPKSPHPRPLADCQAHRRARLRDLLVRTHAGSKGLQGTSAHRPRVATYGRVDASADTVPDCFVWGGEGWEMTQLEMILTIIVGCSLSAAMYFAIEESLHRAQIKLLQAQRRMDKKARDEGMIFSPDIVGLWPDLDEKELLRERVRELERDAS